MDETLDLCCDIYIIVVVSAVSALSLVCAVRSDPIDGFIPKAAMVGCCIGCCIGLHVKKSVAGGRRSNCCVLRAFHVRGAAVRAVLGSDLMDNG